MKLLSTITRRQPLRRNYPWKSLEGRNWLLRKRWITGRKGCIRYLPFADDSDDSDGAVPLERVVGDISLGVIMIGYPEIEETSQPESGTSVSWPRFT